MRPFVYAKYRTNIIAYEEKRLRKSIFQALESNNINYTCNKYDDYDLIHFIYARDLYKVSEELKGNKPTIVNALYCETEKATSMSHYYNSKRTLRLRYIKCLNEADLILVPGERAKNLLVKSGIKTNIKIFHEPIDLTRFEKRKVSKASEAKRKDFILCVGDYQNKLEMENLLEIVTLAPFAKFVFLGANFNIAAANKYVKKSPNNIRFSQLVSDDDFCNIMKKSKMLLILDAKKVEAPNVMEAMAAKTQVVVYNSNAKEVSFLKDGENCYMKNGGYQVVECIENILKKKIPLTTEKAYDFVKQFSIKNSGIRLKKIYSELIQEKKEY